jgi:hypothetical protein
VAPEPPPSTAEATSRRWSRAGPDSPCASCTHPCTHPASLQRCGHAALGAAKAPYSGISANGRSRARTGALLLVVSRPWLPLAVTERHCAASSGCDGSRAAIRSRRFPELHAPLHAPSRRVRRLPNTHARITTPPRSEGCGIERHTGSVGVSCASSHLGIRTPVEGSAAHARLGEPVTAVKRKMESDIRHDLSARRRLARRVPLQLKPATRRSETQLAPARQKALASSPAFARRASRYQPTLASASRS